MSDLLPARRDSIKLDALAVEIRREVQAAEADFQSAVAHAIRAGELLIEAKARVKHGAWLPWLEQYFPGSARSAQGYMRLARHYANAQHVAHLGVGDALREIAATATKTERERISESWDSLSAMDKYFLQRPRILTSEERVLDVYGACEHASLLPLITKIPAGSHWDHDVWIWAGLIDNADCDTGAIVVHPGWARFCHDVAPDEPWWWPLAEPTVDEVEAEVATAEVVDSQVVEPVSEVDAAVRALTDRFTPAELAVAAARLLQETEQPALDIAEAPVP